MYASTAGGGAMSLVFKPHKQVKKGTVRAVKLPDVAEIETESGVKGKRKPPGERL